MVRSRSSNHRVRTPNVRYRHRTNHDARRGDALHHCCRKREQALLFTLFISLSLYEHCNAKENARIKRWNSIKRNEIVTEFLDFICELKFQKNVTQSPEKSHSNKSFSQNVTSITWAVIFEKNKNKQEHIFLVDLTKWTSILTTHLNKRKLSVNNTVAIPCSDIFATTHTHKKLMQIKVLFCFFD